MVASLWPSTPAAPPVLPLRLKGSFEHVQSQPLTIQTPEPILRLRFGFPIERHLKGPNFIRGFYLGRPSHPRVLSFPATH
jgi:hypothetical protein